MSLTREQILSAQDRKTVEVPIPEWGEGASVFVRTLSGGERDELEQAIGAAGKTGGIMKDSRARFAAAFASDADGAPLFTLADVDVLTGKDGSALSKIVEAGLKINPMGTASEGSDG